jgi:hypothetical protein
MNTNRGNGATTMTQVLQWYGKGTIFLNIVWILFLILLILGISFTSHKEYLMVLMTEPINFSLYESDLAAKTLC